MTCFPGSLPSGIKLTLFNFTIFTVLRLAAEVFEKKNIKILFIIQNDIGVLSLLSASSVPDPVTAAHEATKAQTGEMAKRHNREIAKR